MILVPVVLGFPAMVFTIPPLVKLSPTLLSFGIQIASAIVSLTAVRTFPLYCLIESSCGAAIETERKNAVAITAAETAFPSFNFPDIVFKRISYRVYGREPTRF